MEGDRYRLDIPLFAQHQFVAAVLCLVVCCLLCNELFAGQPPKPQRLRHRAAGISLFCYETASGGVNLLEHDKNLAGTISALHKFGYILVHESGFVLPEVIRTLQPPPFEDSTPGNIVRQLTKVGHPASATENHCKGRLTPTIHSPQPSVVLLATTLALAYGMHTDDGLRAVSQCAGLYTRDPRVIACARAGFLMVAMSVAGRTNKDYIIRCAADAAGLPVIASLLLSMRVRDWRELAPDSTTTGWFIRAAKVWYGCHTYPQTLACARRILQPQDARRFVAVMGGAYYSLPLLPENLVARAIASPKTNVLLADMFRLCNEGFLVSVPNRKTKRLQSASGPCKPLPTESTQKVRALPPGPTLALTDKSTPQQQATVLQHQDPPGLSAKIQTEIPSLTASRSCSPSKHQYPPKPAQPAPPQTAPLPQQTGIKRLPAPKMPPVPKFPTPPAIPGIPDMPDD